MRECIVVNNQNIQQNIDSNITDNTLDNINEYNGLPIDELDTEIDID